MTDKREWILTFDMCLGALQVFVRSASTQGLVRPEAFGEMNIFKTPGENGEDLVFLMVDDFSYPLVGQVCGKLLSNDAKSCTPLNRKSCSQS